MLNKLRKDYRGKASNTYDIVHIAELKMQGLLDQLDGDQFWIHDDYDREINLIGLEDFVGAYKTVDMIN